MLWTVLIILAAVFWLLGKILRHSDDVHAIAVKTTGLVSLVWGFTWAPPAVQLLIGGVLFGLNRYHACRL